MTRRHVIVVLVALALAAGALLGGDGDGSHAAPATRAGVITRVIDGDTAVLAALGPSRLIGVDTPEIHGRTECFGAQASAFARRVLAGQRVRWAPGVQARDRYGRALVYVWLEDGRLFNEMLVAGGYARPLAIAPNMRYAARLRRRAREARRAARGLWSQRTCRP